MSDYCSLIMVIESSMRTNSSVRESILPEGPGGDVWYQGD